MKYKGTHVNGSGQAHRCDKYYPHAFGCPMFGTFNIKLEDFPGIKAFESVREVEFTPGSIGDMWLCKITPPGGRPRRAWVIRGRKSKQKKDVVEVVSRSRLGPQFKGDVEFEVLERWDRGRINHEASSWYGSSFRQSYSWSPQRCDSKRIWNACAARISDWGGMTVRDYGCSYGYHSIQAAHAGAEVTGYDISPEGVWISQTIADHIEMVDVDFQVGDASQLGRGSQCSAIFYFSVHHQWDPHYAKLREWISASVACADHIFIELIMPPMFGAQSVDEIDKIVGGQVLDNYEHSVRGVRRIYHIGEKS